MTDIYRPIGEDEFKGHGYFIAVSTTNEWVIKGRPSVLEKPVAKAQNGQLLIIKSTDRLDWFQLVGIWITNQGITGFRHPIPNYLPNLEYFIHRRHLKDIERRK